MPDHGPSLISAIRLGVSCYEHQPLPRPNPLSYRKFMVHINILCHLKHISLPALDSIEPYGRPSSVLSRLPMKPSERDRPSSGHPLWFPKGRLPCGMRRPYLHSARFWMFQRGLCFVFLSSLLPFLDLSACLIRCESKKGRLWMPLACTCYIRHSDGAVCLLFHINIRPCFWRTA